MTPLFPTRRSSDRTMPDPTPAQQTMSDRVMDAFVRFARSGDPGWPAYDLARRQTMIFDTESRVENDPRQWERELFARVPYIQPRSEEHTSELQSLMRISYAVF